MKFSDLRLVENCQHPYPAADQAEGLIIYGDNIILPSKCSLLMLESANKPGIYCVNLKLIPNAESGQQTHSVYDFCNSALALLNLPDIEEIDQEREILPAINTIQMEDLEDCDIGFNVNRKNFERIFRRVAESDYVQMLDSPYIYYVISHQLDLCGNLLRRIYRQEHPDVRFKCSTSGVMEPKLSAILERELKLAGMVSYDPVDIHLFEENMSHGENGLFYGWCPWAGWM